MKIEIPAHMIVGTKYKPSEFIDLVRLVIETAVAVNANTERLDRMEGHRHDYYNSESAQVRTTSPKYPARPKTPELPQSEDNIPMPPVMPAKDQPEAGHWECLHGCGPVRAEAVIDGDYHMADVAKGNPTKHIVKWFPNPDPPRVVDDGTRVPEEQPEEQQEVGHCDPCAAEHGICDQCYNEPPPKDEQQESESNWEQWWHDLGERLKSACPEEWEKEKARIEAIIAQPPPKNEEPEGMEESLAIISGRQLRTYPADTREYHIGRVPENEAGLWGIMYEAWDALVAENADLKEK